MSLTDDINSLPTTPREVMPGHLDHHATIHSALKNHNSRLWDRPDITSGTDLNLVLESGSHTIPSYAVAETLVNRPQSVDAVDRAELRVYGSSSGIHQTWTPVRPAGVLSPIMHRRRDNVGTWTPWVRLDDITAESRAAIMAEIGVAAWLKSALTGSENLNDLSTSGMYRISTYTIANRLSNKPELNTAINPAILEVKSLATGQVEQVWTTLPAAGVDAPVMSRRRDNGGVWTLWVRSGKTDLVDGSTRSHQLHDRGLIRLAAQYSQDATPVWGWSAPPGEHLTIPTHEGSGQAIHPSVLYFPNGWNGWKYWMAHTPYPNFAESHEDPNIVVSNDGTTWQVPVGLTNPLDDQTGRPNPHNSDTHLTMGPDGQMVMSWRMVNRPEGARNQFFWRTSTNGVTWTAKREIWAPPTSDYHSSTVSQSLTWTGSRWRMYFISSTPAPNQLVWVETTSRNPTATSWGAPVTCTFDFPIPGDRDFWHVETQRHDGQWIGIISDGNRGSTGTNGSIYLMRSSDGTDWEVSPVPLVPQVGDRHDSLYKTGFVVSGTGANMSLDVYYSAYDRTSRVWGTWRTKAVYTGGAPKAEYATRESVDAADQALGQRITDEKWRRPSNLGSSANLDDMSGSSHQGLYATLSAVQGLPKATPGWVEIRYESTAARTIQRFWPSSPSENWTLERTYSGGSWGSWRPTHWRGQPITSGTIDTVTSPGQYPVTTANVDGTPISSIGSLEVMMGGSGANSLLQRYVTSSSTPSVWVRPRSGSEWGPWVHVGGHARHLGSTGDLNDEVLPGTLNITYALVKNLPIAVVGSVEILPASGGVLQRFTTGGGTPRVLMRHLPPGGTWGEWYEPSKVRPRPVTYNPSETIKSLGLIPYAVSADGLASWNYSSNNLRQSLDGGHEWDLVRSFAGQSIEFIEELANGEIILATTGTVDGQSSMRRVWVSTGYDRGNPSLATWDVKITGQAHMVKFVDWCFYQNDNILLMNEYGPKSGYTWGGGSTPIAEGENARYTWMSEDYGVTWRQVFDLNTWLTDNGRLNADGQHLHGVAWDKYWNRIWITFGDNNGGAATNGIIYSDNKGSSWHAAHWTGTAPSVGQVVGIQPMKDCIVFAGDMTPSGFLRIDRAGGKTRTKWDVVTGFEYSTTDLHLCHSIVHKEFPQGGEVTLMGFSQEGSNSPSFIIATRDGYHTDMIWLDEQNRSLGLRTMAGPTDRGELIAAINTKDGTVELRGVLDVFGSDWSTIHRIQDRLSTVSPIFGTGSPEGKITATVGTQYTDQAATNGAIRWIKTSGNGATGWVVEYGDTGWRDVTENTRNETTTAVLDETARVFIRRTDRAIIVKLVGGISTQASYGSLFQISVGFRPDIDTEVSVTKGVTLRNTRSWLRWEDSAADRIIVSPDRSIEASWTPAPQWPTSLPGTPA